MTMNERGETEDQEQAEFRYDDLTSAREAAKLLRVSESTVWRWINQDIVPAYRVGRKRVWLRRSELESLVAPARKALRGAGRRRREQVSDRERLNLTAMATMRRPGGDEVARARALAAAVLARRGGEPLPEAWEDIDATREERLAAL
jgi:excisionase family DNA binding protein